MVFFWSCIALSGSVFTFWCTTTDSPSTLPFTSVSNFYPTFRSPSTTQFKPGIHPCLNSANHAFLALQGHIRRVTHSFKHVSPWVSLLLILSGDVSINPSPGTSVLTGSLINIRSIRNKSAAFEDFINSNKSDVIAVTETCLRPDDTDSFIADVTLPGYKYTHVPEAVVWGSSFVMTSISRSYPNHASIPLSISVQLSMGNTQDIIFHTLYRPPNVSKAKFIGEFTTFVECAALTCCENIILGDLNLHLDKQDVWLQKFSDSLCQCNFTQIVDSPTHIHGHILVGVQRIKILRTESIRESIIANQIDSRINLT